MTPHGQENHRSLDAGRLWAGGAATAVVAALVAVVGILLSRGVLHISVLAPEGGGVWVNADTVTYAIGAAVCALAATALMHLLVIATPSPTSFFGWIMVLVTLVGVVVPIGLLASLDERLATATINLAIGLAITFLLVKTANAARRSTSSAHPTGGYPPPAMGGPRG